VAVRQFDWEVSYDADGYIGLLDTFSGHITMAEPLRQRLYAEIRRRLSQRPDDLLRRHWGSVLHVARRLDGPGPAVLTGYARRRSATAFSTRRCRVCSVLAPSMASTCRS
jgi:hypothetical protein